MQYIHDAHVHLGGFGAVVTVGGEAYCLLVIHVPLARGGGGSSLLSVLSLCHRDDSSFALPRPPTPTNPPLIVNPPPPTEGAFITFLWTGWASSMILSIKASFGAIIWGPCHDWAFLRIWWNLGSGPGQEIECSPWKNYVLYRPVQLESAQRRKGGRGVGRIVNFVIIVGIVVVGIVLVAHQPPGSLNDTLESMKSVHVPHPQLFLSHNLQIQKTVLMFYAITVRV